MKDFYQISIRPSTIARLLGSVAFILAIAYIAGQFAKYALGHGHLLGLVHLFDLDAEENVPSYFSLFLLIIAALLLTFIAIINRKQHLPNVSKWVVLALGFMLMSYDEAFSLHEQLVWPVRKLLGGNSSGIFYYAWVIPGILLVFILGCYFFRFLLDLSAKTRLRFLMSAVIYIGGSIGFELIGGKYADLHGERSFTYAMLVTVEESLEMSGVIVFIWALLKYISEEFREVRIGFDFAPGHRIQDVDGGVFATDRRRD
jgi:hypothetical protein